MKWWIKFAKFSPKVKPRVLMRALLHITIDTDETTERPNAPIVPSWYLLVSLIFTLPSWSRNLNIYSQIHRFHKIQGSAITTSYSENNATPIYLIWIFELTQRKKKKEASITKSGSACRRRNNNSDTYDFTKDINTNSKKRKKDTRNRDFKP